MNQFIKYIFLGNIDKKVIIGTYPIKKDKQIENCYKKSKVIFDSIILTNDIKKNIHQKKIIDKEICYFTIKNTDIFYLIITPKTTDENIAISFIEEVQNCNIYLLVNHKTNTLNDYGKNELKKIFIEFNKNPILVSSNRNLTRFETIESEVKDSKLYNNSDLKSVSNSIEDLNRLETKFVEIRSSSENLNFKKSKFNNLWENKKFKIVFVTLIILIVIGLLIIVTNNEQ